MSSKFRKGSTSKEKKELKEQLLDKIFKETKDGQQQINLVVDAKEKLEKFEEEQKRQIEAEQQIQEQNPLDLLQIKPPSKTVEQDHNEIHRNKPKKEAPNKPRTNSVGRRNAVKDVDPLATSSSEDPLPELQFSEPPLNLRERRQSNVSFVNPDANQQAALERDVQDLTKKLTKQAKKIEKQERKIDKLENKYTQVKASLKLAENEKKQIKEESNYKLEQLKKLLDDEQKDTKKLKEENKLLKEKAMLFESQYNRAQIDLTNFTKFQSDRSTALKVLQENLQNKNQDIFEQAKQIAEMKYFCNEAKKELELEKNKHLQTQNKLYQAESAKEMLESQVEDLEQQLDILADQNSEIETKLVEKTLKYSQLKEYVVQLERKNEEQHIDIPTLQEVYDQRNKNVQLSIQNTQQTEEIRKLKLDVQLGQQKLELMESVNKENQRLKDEITMIEATLEKWKRKNRDEMEYFCRQRDVNEEKEKVLSKIEDDLKLKEYNILQQVKQYEELRATIDHLKVVIEDKNIQISELEGRYQTQMKKMEDQLGLARDRLEIESIKAIPRYDSGTYRSPFSVPALNTKYQRQYL